MGQKTSRLDSEYSLIDADQSSDNSLIRDMNFKGFQLQDPKLGSANLWQTFAFKGIWDFRRSRLRRKRPKYSPLDSPGIESISPVNWPSPTNSD
ncbi:hypothetical protein GEMRC1_002993 [Eukaryota sp. GEM-RC1]